MFWKAINIYLNKYKFSNVESTDLKKVFEETSGKNLDQFFKQWVYAVGHPKLEVESVFMPDDKTLKCNNFTNSERRQSSRTFLFFLWKLPF